MPGPYRCGCNASYGQSCPDCDGTTAEDTELRRAKTTRYRQQMIAEKTNTATEGEE